ncbi:hypothetical protein BR93DRAFT_935219 [Coniochaeta sp. PMI_546]|nr:hypothetical protein BR93DRAFT_935219 [Coniochaeta sp. PMI_546]
MADYKKNLRIEKELKPLLHRYGIQYPPDAKKDALIRLLEDQEVPLHRVKPRAGPAPALDEIEDLGVDQITEDFPPDTDTDLPDAYTHEQNARQAGVPPVTSNLLQERELRLLTDYPVTKECLPTIRRALADSRLQEKVLSLINWFASSAKVLKIDVAYAMVFLDSYLTTDKLNFVDYLLDKNNARNSWFEVTSNPNSRKQAAKRLSHLWDIALNPTSSASQNVTSDDSTAVEGAEFFMEITDPYDGMKTKAKVIGKHMSKNKVLGVRADSLSKEHPDLGRGFWIDCKQGPELEAYNKYVKGPNRKLESADALLLGNCTSPDSFDLDCVFTMKWGNSYHWYGYGRPKNNSTIAKMMFSRSTLSKGWKGASTTMRALEHHLRKVGQTPPLAGSTDTLDQITLRAKRKVVVVEEEVVEEVVEEAVEEIEEEL